MSLHVLADHMASKGRNGDSMLVHMTPGEVAGLHALAIKHGGQLTINPETGLPEANFLKKLLPMAAGFLLGPAGIGIAESALGAAAMVGGATGIATGSLQKGLMAGLGAYGGFGLGEALAGAGAGTLSSGALGTQALETAGYTPEIAAGTPLSEASALTHGAAQQAPFMDRLSAGIDVAKAAPMDFLKTNAKYLGAAAAPIVADMMVPTTTKMPTTATSPAYIRQKLYDPYTQTYKSLAPVEADKWGSRSFSDAYTNPQTGEVATLQPRAPSMATGGIVALATGGTGADAAGGQTVADLYASIGRTPDAEGQAFWESAFGKGPVTADQAASFMQSANAVMAKEAAPAAVATPMVSAAPAGIQTVAPTVSAPVAEDYSGGVAALQPQASAPQQTTTAPNPQNVVTNIYRNVLGRDPDAEGLNFWSNAIANGRSPDSVYQDILKSANTIKQSGNLGNFDIKDLSYAQAAAPYTGYTSTAGNTVADEWVRNVLGREATDADRQQSWYKDASNLKTGADASKVYKDFTTYAGKEAASTVAQKVADARDLLASKGLTEADVQKQTGKTIAQLVASGINLDLGWMQAAQLKPATTSGFDFNSILKAKTILPTNWQTGAPVGTLNPYGNINNPGDLTYNPDGSITVQPNIPGRPYGGFSGMGEVKNAYTAGGGSLGYVSPTVKTAAEHEARYNRLTGDSQAAYNYLMGKGANPVQSVAATSDTGIQRPYWTGGARYAPKFLKTNPDGTVSSSTTNPNAPKSGTTPSAQSINVTTPSGAVVTALLGSDGIYRTSDGSKYDVTGKPLVTESINTEGAADGGLMGYSVGGGLGSLGGYSDGGRLLKGPGDGVSDSIPATIGAKQQPARLADGEFVVPARIVSELGNGSTDAGAKKLYAMMDRVQKARGKTTGKNKVAANSRADKYLPA